MPHPDRPVERRSRDQAAASPGHGADAAPTPDGPGPDAWDEVAVAALAEVRRWRRAHPAATLTEIETAVEDRVRGLVAWVVVDAAEASPAAAPSRPGGPRSPCPDCGEAMRADGTEVRRLTTGVTRR